MLHLALYAFHLINNIFTLAVKVKENVKCWLFSNVFVSTWLQHRVLAPNKRGVHFPVLEEMLNFLSLPFSICVPVIIFLDFCFF